MKRGKVIKFSFTGYTDGPLSLEALQANFPVAKGLVYLDTDGEEVVVPDI